MQEGGNSLRYLTWVLYLPSIMSYYRLLDNDASIGERQVL